VTFLRRYPVALTAAALILVAATGFFRLEGLANENRTLIDRANNETIARQVETCATAREFRLTFPDILRQVANPPDTGSSGTDFTKVPGFDALDPATQNYLIALGVVLSADDDDDDSPSVLEQTAARYERDFPVPDCEELKAQRGAGG
jgi:hypothetical protein